MEAAVYIKSSILPGYLTLPNDFLKKTLENTSINVFLYLYGKKHLRPNTNSALF